MAKKGKRPARQKNQTGADLQEWAAVLNTLAADLRAVADEMTAGEIDQLALHHWAGAGRGLQSVEAFVRDAEHKLRLAGASPVLRLLDPKKRPTKGDPPANPRPRTDPQTAVA